MPRWFRAGGLVRQRFLQMAAPSGRIFANPITAHSCPIKYDSIRPRTRFAVSGFAFQIGSSTRITRPVSIACTGSAPIAGLTYVSKGSSTVCGAFRYVWHYAGEADKGLPLIVFQVAATEKYALHEGDFYRNSFRHLRWRRFLSHRLEQPRFLAGANSQDDVCNCRGSGDFCQFARLRPFGNRSIGARLSVRWAQSVSRLFGQQHNQLVSKRGGAKLDPGHGARSRRHSIRRHGHCDLYRTGSGGWIAVSFQSRRVVGSFRQYRRGSRPGRRKRHVGVCRHCNRQCRGRVVIVRRATPRAWPRTHSLADQAVAKRHFDHSQSRRGTGRLPCPVVGLRLSRYFRKPGRGADDRDVCQGACQSVSPAWVCAN